MKAKFIIGGAILGAVIAYVRVAAGRGAATS